MPKNKSPIKGVSDTALMVAIYRALETERPDALFRDPLARRLAGEEGRAIVAGLPKGLFFSGWTVVIRTCIIDRFIQEAVASDVDTVLNLGAGLDTRPYRMDLPATLRWIEVDYPGLIDLKESRMAGEKPRCRLERIKMDLAETTMRRALFSQVASQSTKTLVLTEGVTPYLRVEDVSVLADGLRQQKVFQYWIVDYFSPESYKYRERRSVKEAMEKAPFLFQPIDYFGFFKTHGWTPKQIQYIPEEAERLGRPMPVPVIMKWWIKFAMRFAPPERQEAFKKFSGFVLFEPIP